MSYAHIEEKRSTASSDKRLCLICVIGHSTYRCKWGNFSWMCFRFISLQTEIQYFHTFSNGWRWHEINVTDRIIMPWLLLLIFRSFCFILHQFTHDKSEMVCECSSAPSQCELGIEIRSKLQQQKKNSNEKNQKTWSRFVRLLVKYIFQCFGIETCSQMLTKYHSLYQNIYIYAHAHLRRSSRCKPIFACCICVLGCFFLSCLWFSINFSYLESNSHMRFPMGLKTASEIKTKCVIIGGIEFVREHTHTHTFEAIWCICCEKPTY